MKTMKSYLLMLSLMLSAAGFAQNGFIQGTLYEDNGETVPFSQVTVVETEKLLQTDLDGVFQVELPAGTYTLEFYSFGFEKKRITGIEVIAGETNLLGDVVLQQESNVIGAVTVTASADRETEQAILLQRRNATNVMDGISAARFRKVGDSDAAASMKRVVGVSVEGGKYVYVRGLGDRYTKTLLNGLDVPGLDPDRNTIQMDIFPTGIIENIIVNKTFEASLPADFTGGIVDINLKDFPEERQQTISASVGYNPNFHFNGDYLTYEGGNTDFLGFDDGTRAIPAEDNIPQFAQAVGNPNGETGQRYQDILRSFNPTMSTYQTSSLMDFSLGYSIGDMTRHDGYSQGYTFAISYKNSTEYYDEAIYGRYGLNADPSVFEMETREFQTGSFGTNNVLVSILGGYAYKTGTSKYSIKAIHLQNGESKAGIFEYYNSDQGAIFEGIQHNLEYSQRSLSNLLISGKHSYPESNWDVEWKVSPTYSILYDPDVRFTRYEIRNNDFIIGTEAGLPQRIWRNLGELNLSERVDLTKKYTAFDSDAKLQFGLSNTFKNRNYNIRSFNLNVRGGIPLTGNPDELFYEENLWPNPGTGSGTTYDAVFLPTNPNDYNAKVFNTGAYVSTNLELGVRLKGTVGVRVEHFLQLYTGQNQLGTIIYNNEEVLNNINVFPSLSLVYAADEKTNLRFSYSTTVARPSLKEISFAEIFDPLTGRTFVGGLFRDEDVNSNTVFWDGNLQSSIIQNLDFRYELYNAPGSSVSFGVFYKYFQNPIEIVQFVTLANSFQPRNVGDANLFGGEFEIRQNLSFLSEDLKSFSFNGNITYTSSRIQLSPTEYESRVNNAREGQEIDRYRPMAGQAPLVINAGFSYTGTPQTSSAGWEVGLFYNVQSSTLQYVGIVDRPDIYTVPFHSLNLNMTKTFGEDDRQKIGFKVDNILNDDRQSVFRSFNAQDQFFTSLAPGIQFSVSYSYKLD